MTNTKKSNPTATLIAKKVIVNPSAPVAKKVVAKKAAPLQKKKDYGKLSLALHKKMHGKLSVVSKGKLETRDDWSMMYTPGVGAVSSYLAKHPKEARE